MSIAFTSSATPDFNRLAHIYRWMEWASFGPWLQKCRCVFLGLLSDRRRALVLGDGDGRFTARLLHINPKIQIDAVDASSDMLYELLRRAGSNASRVRARHADIRSWQPGNASYDVVVAHFFLDCLTADEIRSLAERLRGVVAPSALWVISEFSIPHAWYGQLFARPLVGSLYWAFGWLTGLKTRALPDHRTTLRQSGFELAEEHRWLGGLLVSELWSNHIH